MDYNKDSHVALLLSENRIPIDCNSEIDNEEIMSWFMDEMYDKIFQNYEKTMIKEIFVAEADTVGKYLHNPSRYTVRRVDDKGFLRVHLCCLIDVS